MNLTSKAISTQSTGSSAATKEVLPAQRFQKVNDDNAPFDSLYFQRKLSVDSPGNPLEKEADDMADKVMRMPNPEPLSLSTSKNFINRKCSECEKEQELQRKENNNDSVSTAPPIVHDVINSSGGKTLDANTRAFMEPRFNYDFSNVKVHEGDLAAKSAASVNAFAYTTGNNIVFNSQQYNTNSDSGKRLLAHELTHVVQQSNSATTLIQRDDIDSKDPPDFGPIEFDANCPKGPTQLGKVLPDPPCNVDTSESDDKKWKRFKFCTGSDIFLDADSPNQLKSFARKHPALARFTIHTYASIEGNKKENENLSCHRARRVARELINGGVAPEQIEVVGKGTATKFGDKLEENRVVVINADITDVPALPELEEGASNQDIINKAIDVISSGNYRLAADAYISFWTCGQIPTLRDAVRRIEVKVSDKRPPKKKDAEESEILKGGLALEEEEFNQMILRTETFNTTDPLNCVIARIIDLTFHHMVLPHLAQSRHKGAIFLVELAGYLPCVDPPSPDKPSGELWWNRPGKDPLQDEQPKGCAPSSLPGAQGSDKGHPRLGHKPVLFTLDNSSLKGIPGGSINWKVDLKTNKSEIGLDDSFTADANVSMQGDAKEFSGYEVGFIRAILDDQSVISYVSGFQLDLNTPAPIRDAEPGTPVPWAKTDFMKSPSENDTIINLTMKDSSNPKKIKFPYAIAPNERLPIDPLAEDIVNMVSRNIRLGIWLIARRKDSPLDLVDIQFLDGTIIDVAQSADITNTEATGRTDTRFEIDIPNAGLSRLTGPIPADYHEQAIGKQSVTKLGEKRIVGREVAPESSKLEANALDEKEYKAQLEKIAEPIRKEMGLTQKLQLMVMIDKKTGRLWVPLSRPDTAKILPIQVQPQQEIAEYVPKEVLDRFAERLFVEARTDLVLLITSSSGRLPFQSKTFSIDDLAIGARKFQHMHTRPGIKEEMRELWRRTVNDNLDHEWSSVIGFDRSGNQLMIPFEERERGPKLEKTDTGIKGRVEICAHKKNPGLHESIIGTVHTHPIFDPVDAEGPSKDDKHFAALSEFLGHEFRSRCGIDHYIIGIENVLRFNGSGVAEDLGDRRDFLGV